MALASSNPMNALKSKVTLTFSAENLPNLDGRSKTDPLLVLWMDNHGRKQFIGQTELIKDNLNPHWVTSIDVDYYFEIAQSMIIEVYDVDDASRLHDLHAQE
jgi:Ca2+-dependent lipid-binding protein